jgi:DNA helicase-2/ATP-dependent DNA helicase PcrA
MTSPEDAFDICANRRAILEGSGNMLVLGGPGSGKTTIALLKARRYVLERLQPEQSVLFLSFSNAAIRRILESAGKVLTHEIAGQIDIKTYHSFAWDILKSHGYLLSSKRQLEIIAAQDAAIMQAGMKEEDWSEEEKRLFEQEGRATYDQFAPRAAELLERSSVARKCFSTAHPLILVDEFQDTDEDQWRLVQALSEHSDIIALGDTEQRIYAWRKGVSATRLSDFAAVLEAEIFDFQNENNRSPATGIAGYARSLLSPDTELELPEDITFKRFRPGQFNVGVRVALIKTWNETVKRAGNRDLNIAIAARSRTMVRLISDVLSQRITLGTREHKPVPHDVMFDQLQITLAARVVAYLLASQNEDRNERLAGCLDRIGNVFRSSGTMTAIKTSDRFGVWAQKCRGGNPPGTKCVSALIGILDSLDASGFSGSPTEDWILARRALEATSVNELKRTGGHARYLRLLRRGSSIEEKLAKLWREHGAYEGAESALEEAILQDQLTDSHREASSISVMTMHQLKGREYDAVLLVEDQHRTFRGRDQETPYMETRRLLQVSLTRARHFAYILSATKNATLNVILEA